MYKKISLIVVLLGVLLTYHAEAQESISQSFESIKALEGTWEGENYAGTPVTLTYEVISGGSAVLERLEPKGEPSMITMYHMNDGKLMMTHYCSAGNQPRMVAKKTGDKKVEFSFVDGTNLSADAIGHMRGLSIYLKSKDELEQVWTFRQDGKDMPGTFKLTRKS